MQFVEAFEIVQSSRPQIGQLALKLGKMTMRQVFTVLAEQSECNRFFGKLAVEMGYITKEDIALLLLMQADRAISLPQALLQIEALDNETLQTQLQLFYQVEATQQNIALKRELATSYSSN